MIILDNHNKTVAERTTIAASLDALGMKARNRFMLPNRISDNEKKRLIALTAKTNSVALGSIYEYQSHILGTNKCHIPNPIESELPIVTSNLFISMPEFPPYISSLSISIR